MTAVTRDTLFKPILSKTESKAEAVSRIAKSALAHDIALRDAKTARLREARLAKEASDREVAATTPKRARRNVKLQTAPVAAL